MMILQSFIIPICRRDNKSTNIDKLYGTAFFTAVSGVFITAGHVWKDVLAEWTDPTRDQYMYGLCVKGQNNKNSFIPITKECIEFAPNELDIAIGRVAFISQSPIKLVHQPLKFMQDVATYGYPIVASESEQNPDLACWMDMRGHKGYVNRETLSKAKQIIKKQEEAELSFRIEAGMSGAPLFVTNGLHVVGGVCLGTRTSEVYEYRIDREEKVSRHLEYGIACMTYSINSWQPNNLSKQEYAQLFL